MFNQNPYEQNISLPIETVYFNSDGKRDKYKKNRWWFRFPGEWFTADRGESIVGIRSIWLMKSKRKIEFSLTLNKYKADDEGNVDVETKNSITINVITWMEVDEKLKKIFSSLNEILMKEVEKNNKELDEAKDTKKCRFIQTDDPNERDFQTDGMYEARSFTEIFYCPLDYDDKSIHCDFTINDYNDDFKEIFNIGSINFIPSDKAVSILEFKDTWDRHSCKVYSDICSQSNHCYLGNSQVYFNPIKYYKIHSTDENFWIEFYNSRHEKIPVILPKGESFIIELVFLQNRKLLYI